MKVTKLESKKLNEEELRSNQNMHEPEDVHIHADLAYGVAREVDTAAQEHAEEVFDELEKNAEGITPKDPDDGNVKMEKNMYTEKITLDESLFTEDADDVNEIAEFLKDSVEWLIDEQMGCSTYKLNDRLGICIGWQDGFDANDEDVIHSSDEPTWAIVAGIKVYTSDDMRTDYDWISYPYFANGDTVDTSVSVSPNEDYDKLANYFVGEFDDMKDWEIEEDGLVIESDNGEEDAVEESCKGKKCSKKLKENYNEVPIELEQDRLNDIVGYTKDKNFETSNLWADDITAVDVMRKGDRLVPSEFDVVGYADVGHKYACVFLEMQDDGHAWHQLEVARIPNSYFVDANKYRELNDEEISDELKGAIIDALSEYDAIDLSGAEFSADHAIRNVGKYGTNESLSPKHRREVRESKELTEKKGEIEELPDNVWQLVYDRLFPGNKNFRPKIATNINKIYDYEDSIIMNSGLGVGDWDIGVAVAKEEDSDLAKAVADELHLATEYRPTKMLRGRNGVIIIKIPEDIATKDASEYVTSIGLDMGTIRPKRGKK